jgi:hypothetical protein
VCVCVERRRAIRGCDPPHTHPTHIRSSTFTYPFSPSRPAAEFFKYVVVLEAGSSEPVVEPEDIGCDDFPYESFVDFWTNDMPCRQHPTARRAFGSSLFHKTLYVAGGWEFTDYAANDLWYRDDKVCHGCAGWGEKLAHRLFFLEAFPLYLTPMPGSHIPKPARNPQIPEGTFTRLPATQTSDTVFEWRADERGCAFEYQVEDAITGTVLRHWSRATSPFDAIDINEPRRTTHFRIRAIDPAGNRDDSYRYGENAWLWTYIPPLPILAIVLGVLFALIALLVAFFLYRRYKKKKALERYMAKRLARKLKAGAASDDDARERKKRKKGKKKKKKFKRPVDPSVAQRDAQLRGKFRTLLRGRADRSARGEYELLTRRPAAKDAIFQDMGEIGRQTRAVRMEMRQIEGQVKDEAARAKAAREAASGVAADAGARMGAGEAKAATMLAGAMRRDAIALEAQMAGRGVDVGATVAPVLAYRKTSATVVPEPFTSAPRGNIKPPASTFPGVPTAGRPPEENVKVTVVTRHAADLVPGGGGGANAGHAGGMRRGSVTGGQQGQQQDGDFRVKNVGKEQYVPASSLLPPTVGGGAGGPPSAVPAVRRASLQPQARLQIPSMRGGFPPTSAGGTSDGDIDLPGAIPDRDSGAGGGGSRPRPSGAGGPDMNAALGGRPGGGGGGGGRLVLPPEARKDR